MNPGDFIHFHRFSGSATLRFSMLPKLKDFPAEIGGSGQKMSE
jgi:hypothetical protein